DIGAFRVFAEQLEFAAQIFASAAAKITVTAAKAGIDHDAIPGTPLGYARPDFIHVASRVRAENMRQGQLDSRPTITHPQVGMIERRRPHPDSDFTRPWLWHWKVCRKM